MSTPQPDLRVLQVVTDRDRRGAQVYATDLATGLRDLGCDVETVALAPGRHGDQIAVDALGSRRRSVKTLWALRRRARTYDVVIAHGSTTLFACAVALAGTRTPFVYRQISDPLFWASTPMRRLRTAAFLRRARHVVSLSEATADVVATHYRLRRTMISVIPNAVRGECFRRPDQVEREAARVELGLPMSSVVALYVGALVQEKGVDLAISSLTNRNDVRLILAGDGPERAELEELSRDLLGDRARFLGPVGDTITLYHAADFLLLPSRGGDSMPAVLIEAGLCGLPAATCPIGAIADVVVDGETGFVVPPDDLPALRRAVEELVDRVSTNRLGVAAEAHCRAHFTIAATAPLWVDLLGRVAR